jgi:uncharacterized protein YdaU (DUF1376 family)
MAEAGLYITLIAMMYERGRPLDDDKAALARLASAPPAAFNRGLKTLLRMKKLIETEGGLWSCRVEKELKTRAQKRVLSSQSARTRWEKDQGKQCPDDANALRTHSKKNATRNQIPDTRDKKQKASPSSKKGSRLSEDWTLSEKNLADAQAQGIVGDRVKVEADKFRDYWIAKPGQGGVKLDWDATWRNWCRNASSRSAAPPARRDRWAGVDDPNAGKSFDEIFGTGNVVAIGGRQ